MNDDNTAPPPTCAGSETPAISFERARAIAAKAREVKRWFSPGSIEIAPWGWQNSDDYILSARQFGEPWWHELADPPIPGPPMIVVSKSSGEVSTFIGASVPDYWRERDGDDDDTPIGDVPD